MPNSPITIRKKTKKLITSTPSSPSSTSSTSSKKKKKPKTKGNKTRKKRRVLIIDPAEPEVIGKPIYENDIKETISTTIIDMPKRMNESYIGLLEELYNIMMKQGEPFRARAYKKAQETVMSINEDIISPDQLKGKPGIGPTIMEKLNEYERTGTLKVLEREKNNPVNKLADIYGIGPKKAKELVDKGITSIDQLRENQNLLNDVQKVGLKYYEDILKRIPRSEIDEFNQVFSKYFQQIATPESKFEIVGSYRRGAESSGDIDVIVTSPQSNVFKQFIDVLIEHKIIIEVLSRGSTKSLVIAKLPNSNIYRRVDFLYTSENEYPFSILYFTGSKMFNTVMRGHALKKGFTLNEHGISKMIDKKKSDKIEGNFKTEKDIFDFLQLEYIDPVNRKDGRAVIPKQSTSTTHLPPTSSPLTQPPLIQPISEKAPKKPNKTRKKREPTNIEPAITEKTILESETVNPNVPIIIDEFKKKGISVLDGLNEKQLSTIIIDLNKRYYNKLPITTDNEYDIIKEHIEKKYPTNMVVKEIGAPVDKNKVKLPYEMWSMDKIKPDTNALSNWMNKYKGPYILSCKLDGVSGLYSTENNEPKLYTRGNGKIGQDISYFIPHLRLPKQKNLVIRGEFVIPKNVFLQKYQSKFANARNLVAGIMNQKTINEIIKDVHFVAYEVIKPELIPSAQMDLLQTLNIETVLHQKENTLSNELLSNILVDWRANYEYEIDGIIVTDDKIYPRKSGNPEHAFAFKMVLSDQVAEAKVVDVIWSPSKDGYLKPRVQIEPIQLGGVTIEYATGFNAAFIEKNKIGVGSMIKIIRSGDVIPYIQEVISPADVTKMPNVPYKWNDTHIDILLEDMTGNETVLEKNITGFFKGLEVDGLGPGNVTRIINAGYNTVPKILNMKIEDFLKVDGFKLKSATKIYDSIQEKLKNASLLKLMSASNLFGRGFSEKKIELILDDYPDVLTSNESPETKIQKVLKIKGMALKSAEAFVDKIPAFLAFLNEVHLMDKLQQPSIPKKSYDTSHPLYNKSIVFTGFRDNELQTGLANVGSKIGSSISKNTNILIVKDEFSKDTGKAIEAIKLGIPIMTKEEFLNLNLI